VNRIKHIAIIPDGNRRWAKEKNKPAQFGHKKGAENFKEILQEAFDLNIKYLTFWGASVSNIKKRNKREIKFLFSLFKEYFEKLSNNEDIHKNKTRIRVLGTWEELLPKNVKSLIKKAIESTKDYNKYNLTFLIAYSGIEEMEQAIKKITKENKRRKLEINQELIKNNLYTKELPPVDLVIRTGGEPHLSEGFMMWDIANAQLRFTKKYFPAFSKKDFRKMVEECNNIKRRFGK